MKKQTKILLIALLTVICVVSVCALTACKGDGGVDGTYYFGYDGKIMQNNYYTLKNKTWTDNGGSSGKFELNGNNITLYVDMFGMQTEYMRGTVSDGVLMLQATVGNFQYYFKDGKIKDVGGKPDPQPTTKVTVTFDANGGSFGGTSMQTLQVDKNSLIAAPDSPTRQNYKFGGWSKTKILGTNLWDFATDTVTEDTTLYAVWKGESARIFSVDGATINDYEINLIVNHDTDSVSLSNKVVCSEDSVWKLYYDKLGQTEIPTKIAASNSGALKNGNNVFYIVVTSKDGVQTNLYTLNVYRSYAVSVSYVANGKVIQTDSAYTGYPYEINYTPKIEGYTFNYWKDGQGAQVTSATPFAPLTFVADATANDYSCKLNVNGGNDLDKTDFTFTYDKQFTLPRAYRTGYTFLGWYVGETQLTNGSGNGVSPWSVSENVTAKAKWQANKYNVALTSQNTDLGNVSGAGEYDYDSRVTVIATPKTGCNFVGWYDNAGKLVSENKSYTFTMGFDVSYTAKFDAYTVTTSRSDTSAGTISKTYTNEKVAVGTKVTLTATVNDGYNFLGWYDKTTDTLVERGLTYVFTMSRKNISVVAKYNYFTVSANRNDSSAGSVTAFSNKKVSVGQSVTLTAATNAGYTWVGWFNGETKLTDELTYTFTMSAVNVTYTAKWEYFTVTTSRSDTSAGTISKTYTNEKVAVGTKVTLTATVNDGYNFLGWYDKTTDTLVERGLTYVFTMSRKNISVVAKYNYFTVSANRNDSSAGSVTAFSNKKVSVGQSVTLTAATNAGYTWVGWFNGETKLTDELTYTFTMSAVNVTYTAKWEYFTVTTATNDSQAGTYTKKSDAKTTVGDEVTLTAATNAGYTWVGWFDGETKLTDELSYTFTMASVNVTYTAKWEYFTVTTATNDSQAGTYTKKSDAKTTVGDEVTLTAATNAGYTWVGWFDGETKLTDELSYTFTMASVNVTYTAKFAVMEEMSNFIFTSTSTTCTITGIKDKTVESIVIPDSVTKIGSSAFQYCSSLTSVTIPDSVTSIGSKAFYYCSKMASITIPNSVTSIGKDAFSSCSDLASINYLGTIESWCSIQGLDNLMYNGFNNTYSKTFSLDGEPVTKLVIPNTVTSIPRYAFYKTNITSVTIPNSVASIGSFAFYGCSSLTSVTIPDSVTSIGSSAFSYCSVLASITIPNSVTSIGSDAFRGCSKLIRITIPDSVTSIGSFAFEGCYFLKSITVSENNTAYASQDGILYNKAKTKIIHIPSDITGSVIIPNGVTSIDVQAFHDCSLLTSITIPNSVTSIGVQAFDGCQKLATIKFAGTISQWNNITKGSNWKFNVPATKVICSNGEVAL